MTQCECKKLRTKNIVRAGQRQKELSASALKFESGGASAVLEWASFLKFESSTTTAGWMAALTHRGCIMDGGT